MDRYQYIAMICGVSLQTVYRWYRTGIIPTYALNLIAHNIDGKVFYKGWEQYQFFKDRLYCMKTNQYVHVNEINQMWIIRQQIANNCKSIEKLNSSDLTLKELLFL